MTLNVLSRSQNRTCICCDDDILRVDNFGGGGWDSSDYTLRLWDMFCDSIPDTIPGLKDFGLGYCITDGETSKRVLGRMESFPLLSRCAFCLDPFADRETLGIAREMAYSRRSMTKATPSTPFRFLDLPVKLQLMVMEHLLIYQWDPFVPLLPVCLPRRLSEGQILHTALASLFLRDMYTVANSAFFSRNRF